MIQHRAVEFLVGTASFSPLKILDRIRPVGDRLHRGEHMHSRTFHRIIVSPVDHGRHALHQEERFFLHAAHHAVVKRRPDRRGNLVFLSVPERIIVPRHDIQLFLQPVVIDVLKYIHKVCRRRKIRVRRHGASLHAAEITDLVRDKSVPVKLQCGDGRLSVGRRAVDLLPVCIYMAPETAPPRLIQRVRRTVFFFQPLSESALAQIAVAGSVTEIPRQLIGQMPEDHIFFLPEPL